MPDEEYRRKIDAHITALQSDVSELRGGFAVLKSNTDSLHEEVRCVMKGVTSMQVWVEDNAQATRDVREILSSFRLMGAVSKWITSIAGACAVVWAGLKGFGK